MFLPSLFFLFQNNNKKAILENLFKVTYNLFITRLYILSLIARELGMKRNS